MNLCLLCLLSLLFLYYLTAFSNFNMKIVASYYYTLFCRIWLLSFLMRDRKWVNPEERGVREEIERKRGREKDDRIYYMRKEVILKPSLKYNNIKNKVLSFYTYFSNMKCLTLFLFGWVSSCLCNSFYLIVPLTNACHNEYLWFFILCFLHTHVNLYHCPKVQIFVV